MSKPGTETETGTGSDAPTVVVPEREDVPAEHRERDQWLMWDASSDTPRRPHWRGDFSISWTDPADWHSFEEAREGALERDSWGIGYVFAKTNDDYPRGIYGALDLDGCADADGHPKEWVPSLEPFADRDAYIEWSPSRREPGDSGLHIPLAGFEPPEWWSDQHFTDDEHEGVEAYGSKFFTVTGDRLRGAGDTVADTGEWVEEWLAQAHKSITGEDPRAGATEGDSSALDGGGSSGETGSRTGTGGEWMDEETTAEALEHIDPDVAYSTWRDIGFALVDEFSKNTARSLFEDWSRGGSKWSDDGNDRLVDNIIEGAETGGGRSIATVVYYAKQGGWNASAAAREAGGRSTTSDDVDDDDGPTDANLDLIGWETIQDLYRSDERGTTGEATQGAALRLLEEYDLLTVEDSDVIWRYDRETGVFRDDAEARLRSRLADGLGWTYSRSRVTDILHRIRSETYVEADALGAGEDDAHLLCVANGVLDLRELREKVREAGVSPREAARSLEVRPHSPEYRFISRLEVEYDPAADGDDHPGWECWTRYIGERVEPRDITNVREYAGYCLHGEYPFKKAFLALGPHNSGKTTFLSAIHRLFPDDSVATEPVQDLTNNRFSAANLHGARVNIAGDLGTRELKDLERFKTITGGEERMRAEIKGKQAFPFKPTAKFLWAANEVPEVDHPDDKAFINRWVFAEFPDEVEEPDDRVKQRLLQDETLRAVLLWALGGYATLFGWEGSNRGFSEERTVEAKRAMWNKHGDTIDQFIVRCLELTGDPDDAIAVPDTYRAYQEFCHHREKPSEGKRSLGDTILAQALVSDGQRRVNSPFSATDRPRCYIGVRYSEVGAQFWAAAAGEISRDDLEGTVDTLGTDADADADETPDDA